MLCRTIATLYLHIATALSNPVLHRSFLPSDAPNHVQCASIDTYTVDWFLKSASQRKNIDLPLRNALFYTRGMSDTAKEYACDHDLITIWSVWDQFLYDYTPSPNNAMRCIHNDETKRRRFFASMSEAYARLAVGSVIVMHDAKDWSNPPSDGIWHNVEYETMVNSKAVTTILKVKEQDVKSARVMWDRELPLAEVSEKPISVVLAIGRYVPFFLGTAEDWVSGPIESAKQVMLNGKLQREAHSDRHACSRVPDYPFEVY
ncbi:hypothetical protein G6514_004213 [Epicoccum nigrum]|nr:hypothetical protein G6514_004213 [Epicoccum nigrum]